MTEGISDFEAVESPRWLDDAHIVTARDIWQAYRHAVRQAFKEGVSIRRVARQFGGGHIFFLMGAGASETAFLRRVGRNLQEPPELFADPNDLRKVEDDGFEMVYRAVDAYSALSSASDALYRLSGLQVKLGEATQYAARVAFEIVSRDPHRVRVVQSVQREDWVETSIGLERAGEREKALDVIFDRLDDLLLAAQSDESKFRECDAAIAGVPAERMSNAQLLTVLTATAGAKDRLPSRASFYARAKAVMEKRGADANRLLVGLE